MKMNRAKRLIKIYRAIEGLLVWTMRNLKGVTEDDVSNIFSCLPKKVEKLNQRPSGWSDILWKLNTTHNF